MSSDDKGDDSAGGPNRTFEYVTGEATPASVGIVHALCAIENVDPVNAPEELDMTLYDHIDPTALDAIVTHGSDDGTVRVEFTLREYRITVTDSGTISVQLRE